MECFGISGLLQAALISAGVAVWMTVSKIDFTIPTGRLGINRRYRLNHPNHLNHQIVRDGNRVGIGAAPE